jgi:uncharacterized OsmC-like protein
MKTTITYLGSLRNECIHENGTKIQTDAPIDNHGKGELFSPTDLLATSLGSCFLTIVGIYCQTHSIPFNHAEIKVEKHMASNPRKVERLVLDVDFRGNNWDEKTTERVVRAGKTCPVALTLGENVIIAYNFI